jgi:ribonucleoside-diphosphate reductase alpha chain
MVCGTIEPMLSENALRVLEARYLRRDEYRRLIETPEELFRRVAGAVASAERQWGGADDAARWEAAFFELLRPLEFLPNSPALMNAGMPEGQLSACFVLPIGDTMAEIFEALKQMALIQRTGGGTGFSFSRLRPAGDPVASSGGRASGPVSFMRVFDAATEHIKQGGKRRGANMGALRVDHPDILEFIRAKRDGASLRNFNLSVGVTDAFMEAAGRGDCYTLIHPRTGRSAGRARADQVFEEIAQAAWQTGDPGLLFLDAINRANPTPQLGAIEATNPCGEIPLLPYESCNLGSLNLARFLGERDGRAEMDWMRLRAAVGTAVRFLDDMIDVTASPIPEIARVSRGTRKIGLGVSYASDEAARQAEQIMRTIAQEARAASQALAETRGVFPSWPGSVHERDGVRVRNAARTAIAPTGTISMIAGTSAGIEPLFAVAYRRANVLDGQTLPDVAPLFLEHLGRSGAEADALIREVLREGTLAKVAAAPEEMKRLFVTALEIPAEQHLRIQAAFQRHVDSAVSKTINLPRAAIVADVARAYGRAWELGLKGITIFRYGSAGAQVLELGIGEEARHYEHITRCDPEECRV